MYLDTMEPSKQLAVAGASALGAALAFKLFPDAGIGMVALVAGVGSGLTDANWALPNKLQASDDQWIFPWDFCVGTAVTTGLLTLGGLTFFPARFVPEIAASALIAGGLTSFVKSTYQNKAGRPPQY